MYNDYGEFNDGTNMFEEEKRYDREREFYETDIAINLKDDIEGYEESSETFQSIAFPAVLIIFVSIIGSPFLLSPIVQAIEEGDCLNVVVMFGSAILWGAIFLSLSDLCRKKENKISKELRDKELNYIKEL